MKIKIKITRDYGIYKKDGNVEVDSKLAYWLISNGFAKECNCVDKDSKEGCSDCEEKTKKQTISSSSITDKVTKKKVTKKK